ncbi:exonuclease subunit SbcC [Paenibacillus sp. JCM 10914]
MKPIYLKLSGLQSYRNTQEINFETLCETGLFGIFGPTGSGKSTLLDAITLAMYGKVERAVNGTQGIMNHSEDQLAVSFTFELTSPAGQERYRVERRFKRVNELSVSNTVSRFIQVTPEGDRVVADKLAEVTRCVEEKIGLKMDDFTRAVVLPQGKFAEFLSLKGTERRQMLQRLFHLERYGDQLGIKLSRRVKETEGSLKSVEAEQQGLGNAGKEALVQAEALLVEAREHADALRKKLQGASERHEALGKTRELDMEQKRLQRKLDELALHEEEIKRLERKLERTAAAAEMMPILGAWRESEVQWESRNKTAKALEGQAAAAQQTAQQAGNTEETALTALTEGEPKLLQREQQLEQAASLQQERDTLREELSRLDKQRAEARVDVESVATQLKKEQELLERGRKRREELQLKLKELEIRSSDRQALHIAMQKLQTIEALAAQKLRVEQELLQQEGKAKEQAVKLESLVQQEHRLQRQYIRLATRASQHRSALHELLAFADRTAAGAAEVRQAMAVALREQELHSLSLSLSAQLEEGRPCPVCGSAHHPNPAAVGMLENVEDNRLQLLERSVNDLQEVRLALRQSLHELESLPQESELADMEATLGAVTAADQDNDRAEAAVSYTYPDAKQPYDLAKIEADVEWLTQTTEALAEAVKQCRNELVQVRQENESARHELMRLNTANDNDQAMLEQFRDKLKNFENEITGIRQTWEDTDPAFPLEAAAVRFQNMQERDMESDTLKEGLERSVPFLEEKQQTIQQLERQNRELEKQLIQWDAQFEGKSNVMKDKEEQLRKWIGHQSAQVLLKECRDSLKSLRDAAEQAKRQRRQAEEVSQQVSKEAALAEQAANAAQGQLLSAREKWEHQLQASPFLSEADVREASLSADETERYQHQVNVHRESQREWMIRLGDVVRKMGEHTFEEEDWLRSTAEIQAIRTEDEEAIQRKARAERDLEDLNKRHSRFMELEESRIDLQRDSERLAKLQSCLRGNAFVEYVAEEQLMQVSQSASQRLRYLTKQRYSLEVDSGGGFVIRDDANGGVRRPVSTLSGGETFLTSLALALALSAQIQLRGQYPLQFFFLDEGFGTLDPELLETVITSLERLHHDQLTVGIISHVPELRARLPRKLVVSPAEQAGEGSQLKIETM